MRIGEIADRLGVSTDTVRFYERAGWLPAPVRAENGYRRYSAEDVDHLRLLLDLRRMDIPLEEAAQLASWCHAGHCETTSGTLPGVIARRRAEVEARRAPLPHAADGIGERPAMNPGVHEHVTARVRDEEADHRDGRARSGRPVAEEAAQVEIDETAAQGKDVHGGSP